MYVGVDSCVGFWDLGLSVWGLLALRVCCGLSCGLLLFVVWLPYGFCWFSGFLNFGVSTFSVLFCVCLLDFWSSVPNFEPFWFGFF